MTNDGKALYCNQESAVELAKYFPSGISAKRAVKDAENTPNVTVKVQRK